MRGLSENSIYRTRKPMKMLESSKKAHIAQGWRTLPSRTGG